MLVLRRQERALSSSHAGRWFILIQLSILNFHSVLWQEAPQLTHLACEDFPVTILDVSAGNPAVCSAELPALRPLAVGFISNCDTEIGCDMPPWEGCCVPWGGGVGWLISSWSTGTSRLCLWGVDGKVGTLWHRCVWSDICKGTVTQLVLLKWRGGVCKWTEWNKAPHGTVGCKTISSLQQLWQLQALAVKRHVPS